MRSLMYLDSGIFKIPYKLSNSLYKIISKRSSTAMSETLWQDMHRPIARLFLEKKTKQLYNASSTKSALENRIVIVSIGNQLD